MAFTLASFLLAFLMLLVMVARFFTSMDTIVVIQDPVLTLTLLDLACVAYLFYVLYDFMHWLAGWKPSKVAKKDKKGA